MKDLLKIFVAMIVMIAILASGAFIYERFGKSEQLMHSENTLTLHESVVATPEPTPEPEATPAAPEPQEVADIKTESDAEPDIDGEHDAEHEGEHDAELTNDAKPVTEDEDISLMDTIVITPEPAPEVTAMPTAAPESPKSVVLQWEGGKLPSVIRYGAPVRLIAVISGFDGYTVQYAWYVKYADSDHFEKINGASDSSLVIHATKESIGATYRVEVRYQ